MTEPARTTEVADQATVQQASPSAATSQPEVPDAGATLPTQSEEDRQAELDRSGAAQTTATGQAKSFLSGDEQKRIESLESRGSQVEIAGTPKADFAAAEGAQPEGLQAEQATFVANGTVDPNTVASPSGPVPMSAVTNNPQRAQQLKEAQLRTFSENRNRRGNQPIEEGRVNSMTAAELRAVANDRGYDLGNIAGARATRARFLRAQQKDETLQEQQG